MIISRVKNLSTWQSTMWRICSHEKPSCGQISPQGRFFSTGIMTRVPMTNIRCGVWTLSLSPFLNTLKDIWTKSFSWTELSVEGTSLFQKLFTLAMGTGPIGLTKVIHMIYDNISSTLSVMLIPTQKWIVQGLGTWSLIYLSNFTKNFLFFQCIALMARK